MALIAIGGAACLISVLWALFGRMDGDFGSVTDRWAVAGVGEYLQNAQKSKVDVVRYLRFAPVVGLFAYLLCWNLDEELWPNLKQSYNWCNARFQRNYLNSRVCASPAQGNLLILGVER
ncbi:hypothetical protein NC653_021057 [Populus alba x Populus x berolinensis]|uniref:Uncharacterized protein n=1 Tax=Populus alba x Populus x berolinensis TaxID=444605 RepID=A0AAD6MNX5_9ROSI|nr:hypothetical protein NC653_021057 [Populus alba x Populus x berolinensis]